MMVTKYCKHCGKDFLIRPSHFDEKVFCSPECRKTVKNCIKKCPHCKREFKTKAYYKNRIRYCSRKCYIEAIAPQDTVQCERCGKSATYAPSIASRRRYCSDDCYRHANAKPPQLLACRGCGEMFKTYEAVQYFCSRQCRIRFNKREKACLGCRKVFPIDKVSHYDVIFYCSKQCMANHYKVRYSGDANPNFRDLPPKRCELCHSEYRSYNKTRRYCSLLCAQRANHAGWMARLPATPRGKCGRRPDLNNLFVRSSWEANYARFLNWQKAQGAIKDWEYEADTFEFVSIKKGSRFYTPDFKVITSDDSIEYHEVKGWMTDKSATKLKRMAKYFPAIKLVLIDKNAYQNLAKQLKRLIPHWESPNGRG